LDERRPTAYVTLGSSGRADVLPMVLEQLSAAGVQSLVATAGRVKLATLPPHTFVADFLPGDDAARRADFVVSNGGSTTGYQALLADRPVLGVASNLDQQLASGAIARAGAGLALRAGTLRASALRAAIARLVNDDRLRAAAHGVGSALRAWDAAARFRSFVDDAVGGRIRSAAAQ
jgi:UDP:flavonoid glycosyltransferase YjiC (YdhE family)